MLFLKLEEGTFENDFLDENYSIEIWLNDKEIGSIIGFATEEDIYIEHKTLDKEFQRKGYGTLAINQLKEIAKSLNVPYLHGECRTNLIQFYEKLGADFKHRTEEDKTYINHRFYIDL